MNPSLAEQGRLFAAIKRVNRRVRLRVALAEAAAAFGPPVAADRRCREFGFRFTQQGQGKGNAT